MKYMSFSATIQQILDHTKTVTRRLKCRFHVDDIICAVEKMRGLKKGEHYKKLAYIRIIKDGIRQERLDILLECFTKSGLFNIVPIWEMEAEGFPDLSPTEFVYMFCKLNHCKPDALVYRIEFEYLTDEEVKLYESPDKGI